MDARLDHAPATDRDAAPTPEPVSAPEPEWLGPETERLALPGLARPEPEATIRRRGDDPLGGSRLPTSTARRLTDTAGRGRGLSPDIREPLESAFQADFGAVNVHTDANAAQLARDVQATAFTHGNNIYFAQGAYDPGSARGQHLLAHELTHVVQQQGGRGGAAAGGGGPVIGRADDPAEREAERTAHDVVGSLRRQAGHAGHGSAEHAAHDHERGQR